VSLSMQMVSVLGRNIREINVLTTGISGTRTILYFGLIKHRNLFGIKLSLEAKEHTMKVHETVG
jgi:hypothetical protein